MGTVPRMTSTTSAVRLGRRRRAAAGNGLDAAKRRADQAWGVLQRLVPLACRVVGWLRGLAIATAVAGVAIVAAVGWRLWGWSSAEVVVQLVIIGVLGTPVVILWLFTAALREVLEIPDHLQAVPQLAARHGAELTDLVRTSRSRHGGGVRGLPADVWRGGRLLLRAREAIPGYGAALTLVSVPFLIASALAVLACVVILVLALPVLAGLLVTAYV